MKRTLLAILFWNAFIPTIDFGQPFTLLKDINPNSPGSGPHSFINYNNNLFFSAADEIHGQELWKSDGTSIGTKMVKDINPVGEITIFGGIPVFRQYKIVNGLLFLVIDDGSHGEELWETDGAESGTKIVKDINASGNSSPRDLTVMNSTLYFIADNGSGYRLYKTDGTETGTVVVNNLVTVFSSLALINNVLLFRGSDSVQNGHAVHFGLWKSDGTEAGTVLVKVISPGDELGPTRQFIGVDQTLFFTGEDGIHGQELWTSDGTEAGTFMLKDINPGAGGSLPGGMGVNGELLVPFKGNLFFSAHDATNEALWKSDGTETGTVLVKDVNQNLVKNPFIPPNRPAAENGIFFIADDQIHGDELWITDGTETGTHMVKDITVGPAFSFGFPISPFFISQSNHVYFELSLPPAGEELWRSDGTEAGTFVLKDVWPGTNGQAIQSLKVWDVNHVTFFNPNDGVHGRELWRTNSTEGGTELVQDFEPGAEGSVIGEMIDVNGTVYASIHTSQFGSELWSSTLAALPISLIDFRGRLTGDHALLNWNTQNEVKNSSFVLERSYDRNNFSKITIVQSKNLPGINEYQYIDSNITHQEKSIVYYRLKQINPDGKFDYSSIVAIRMSNTGISIRIQPNPVKNELKVQLSSRNAQHAKLSVVNVNGLILLQKHITITKGSQFVSFDVSRLPAGTYILSTNTNEGINKEVFIKN